MSHLYKHQLSISKAQTLIPITSLVQEDVKSSGISEGLVVIYCPHTTVGITINENAYPDVVRHVVYGFETAYPTLDPNYKHFEGNSHAHLKASTVGPSQTLILTQGQLLLGRWQGIYFCEFDGPRDRTFYVKVMEG